MWSIAVVAAASAAWAMPYDALMPPWTPPENVSTAESAPAPATRSTRDRRFHGWTAGLQAVEPPPRPEPPAELMGFYHLPPERQLAAIGSLGANPGDRVIRFLSTALFDRTLPDDTRDVIAECLLRQDDFDPDIDRVFISMIHDPAENHGWRELAVRHLARCLRSSDDPRCLIVVMHLKDLMVRGEGRLAGAAMLSLQQLEDRELLMLDTTFSDQIEIILGDARADPQTIAVAMRLARERHQTSALGHIRRHSASPLPSLRLSAVKALDAIGEADDVAVLRSASMDADPAVRDAAASALERRGMTIMRSSH
jgi:hypothetical protein